MAKEFKAYDKEFRSYIGKLFDYELQGTDFDLRLAVAIKEWKWKEAYQIYGHNEVRHAVYLADDAMEWQKFRVSLKGFNTQEKLYRLRYRWTWKVLHEMQYGSDNLAHRERVRINNYLGALVRGGQLNSNLEVPR